MNRITDKHLKHQVDTINRLLGRPLAPWTRTEKGLQANIGNYHLSGAYGGKNLNEMMNGAGGVHCPLNCGHVPKRELHSRLDGFIAGIRAAQF